MIQGELVIDLSHLAVRNGDRLMTRDGRNYFSRFQCSISIQENQLHKELDKLANLVYSIKYNGVRALRIGRDIQEMVEAIRCVSSPESLLGCVNALNRTSTHFKIDIK